MSDELKRLGDGWAWADPGAHYAPIYHEKLRAACLARDIAMHCEEQMVRRQDEAALELLSYFPETHGRKPLWRRRQSQADNLREQIEREESFRGFKCDSLEWEFYWHG